ncbi:MAG: lipoprotein, partial [Eubacterium sp.]|nr:lipoprotein [Eubacterium sp.]
MKKPFYLAIALLLLSGCQTKNASDISTTGENEIYTLKWCLEECYLEEEAIDRLNRPPRKLEKCRMTQQFCR